MFVFVLWPITLNFLVNTDNFWNDCETQIQIRTLHVLCFNSFMMFSNSNYLCPHEQIFLCILNFFFKGIISLERAFSIQKTWYRSTRTLEITQCSHFIVAVAQSYLPFSEKSIKRIKFHLKFVWNDMKLLWSVIYLYFSIMSA